MIGDYKVEQVSFSELQSLGRTVCHGHSVPRLLEIERHNAPMYRKVVHNQYVCRPCSHRHNPQGVDLRGASYDYPTMNCTSLYSGIPRSRHTWSGCNGRADYRAV